MLPFELWLDNIETLHIFRMLCCTNKEVRKYLVLLYPNHAAKTQLISLSPIQPLWLPELCPHKADAWRVHMLLQQIKCRLHRMLGNQTLPPLVVAPRRAGKTELVGTIAAALLLSNRRVVVVATCRRMASNIMSKVVMRQCLELGACCSGYSNFIQHGDGWIQCCISFPTRIADVVLFDEAAYAAPSTIEAAFALAPRLFLISTPTSESNHFSRMCSNPAFNLIKAPSSPWAFVVRWD